MNVRDDAREIFIAGVGRVDPGLLLSHVLRLEGLSLRVHQAQGDFVYDLDGYRHILAVGMGKASAVLARGLEEIVGDRLDEGFVVTKAVDGVVCSKIRLVQGGHPVPDARSAAAGAEILALAHKARAWEASGERTLVVVLVSGGGSALMSAPVSGISLKDKAAVTRLLLGSGATIKEMNVVRKHLSAIKGGRLVEAFAPSTILSLVLSDVVGDDLDAIASGPTVPDASTWEAAQAVLIGRGVWEAVPESVRKLFGEAAKGERPETPKPGSSVFANVRTVLVGNNMLALESAEKEAKRRGYNCLLLTSRLEGEAREVAKLFLALAGDIDCCGRPLGRPACILSGGETTVTLRGKGLGGRNQEMALAFLSGLKSGLSGHGDLIFLSAGTDGNDGPTDAAGAFASTELAERASSLGLDPEAFLADNDSWHFFDKTGGLFRTGSTGTNVCDMQILLLP